MKKIILLLTVLTLGVIACDKNELGDMDSMSINPIEAKVEMSNDDMLNIVGNILNLDVSKSPKRIDNNTNKGNDRLTMHIFLITGETTIYTTYLSEDNDDLCFSDDITSLASVHLNYVNGDIQVTLNDSDTVLSTVTGDFTTLYDLSLDILIKLDSDSNVDAQALFDADNSVTI